MRPALARKVTCTSCNWDRSCGEQQGLVAGIARACSGGSLTTCMIVVRIGRPQLFALQALLRRHRRHWIRGHATQVRTIPQTPWWYSEQDTGSGTQVPDCSLICGAGMSLQGMMNTQTLGSRSAAQVGWRSALWMLTLRRCGGPWCLIACFCMCRRSSGHSAHSQRATSLAAAAPYARQHVKVRLARSSIMSSPTPLD